MINNSNVYAMYLRKSRKDIELEEQGEEETLSRHSKILEELCKKLKIVIADKDIYKEIVSGDTIKDRPQMQFLLEKVNQGYYAGVLVVEIERLARGDTIDQGTVLRSFKYSNTKIITPSKIYDFKDELDEEYLEFGLFMSRREYKVITKRLQRGRIQSAKEGKFVGSKAPYGYNKIKLKGQKGYSLSINQEEAHVVKMIFDLFVNHNYKPADISRHLESLSIVSPSQKEWTVSSVREILRNPTYKGYIKFNNRVISKHIDNNVISKHRNTNKGDLKELIYAKGLHEAIIPPEMFDSAEKLRHSRNVSCSNKNYDIQNPLSKLLKCKLCGRTLVRYTMRGTKRVYCRTLNCRNVSNDIDEIEKEVLIFLRNWIDNKQLLINSADKNISINQDYKSLKLKQEELKSAQKKKEKIYDLFEEQIYDKTTFFERTKKMDFLIMELSKSIEELQEKINNKEKLLVEKNTFIPKVQYVLDNYNKTTNAKVKNQMLKSIIEKIEYLKTTPGNKWHSTKFELWIYPKIPKN